ncbi:MAG: chorismate pyruvate-lyase family protein [Acidimicrobiales bacterium]
MAPLAEPPFLTRFQRILVGTDGTVTPMLEAYADEPIEVVKLFQKYDATVGADAPLELAPDARVLRRRVVLRGRQSKRSLVYAEVAVAVDRVDPAILDGLLTTDTPVGTLLSQRRTETFREILRADREPAGECAAQFGIEPAAEVVSRTYRIFASGRPIMVITERFPATSFQDLSG